MTKKILIVEDEISVLELLLKIFELEGYEVLRAKNGDEALRISKELEPDVLILDKRLPDMDGIEVCTSLKSDKATSHLKILILSGMTQDSDFREAYQAKADAYMTKPFRVNRLVGKVEELLDD